MNSSGKLTGFIAGYGQDVTVCAGNETFKGRALIQPVRHKGRRYQGLEYTGIGAVDDGYYLYIGQGTKAFAQDDATIIQAGGTAYLVERSEVVCIAGEPFYVWAVLRVCTQEVAR